MYPHAQRSFLHTYKTLHLVQVRGVGSTAPTLRVVKPSDIPKTLEIPANLTQKPVEPLTKTDLQRYIYPLLCYGWALNTHLTKPGDFTLSLTRRMVLKGPVSSRKYIRDIFDAEDLLAHHLTDLHLDGEKRPNLTIVTQTHDLSSKHHWLTLRDVGLAGSLENIYREKKYGPNTGSLAVQPPSRCNLDTWDDLIRDYPWDGNRVRITNNTLIEL